MQCSVETPPQVYDLAIAWNWEHDEDFARRIETLAHARTITTYLIRRHNVDETHELLQRRKLHFAVVLDRASDEDEQFQPLARSLSRRALTPGTSPPLRVINPHELQKRAADKATMHLEFLSHGLEVPYTIIISPYNHKRELELSLTELAHLGRPFIIKPANTTGGGIGVVLGAESLKDIFETRQHHKNDKYLLQEKVSPAFLGVDRAWFRVFYAFGSIIPCWWDDQTHIYKEITPKDENSFGLHPLRSIARVIRDICLLDFFSTEIVCTQQQRFVVVDYVNEICDMRIQSRTPDGVPDNVVDRIIHSMLDFVEDFVRSQQASLP
jgi:hypothetical protein